MNEVSGMRSHCKTTHSETILRLLGRGLNLERGLKTIWNEVSLQDYLAHSETIWNKFLFQDYLEEVAFRDCLDKV